MPTREAPSAAPYVSKLQAANHLQLSPPLVPKALEAGILCGPVVNGAQKVDSASLATALAKRPTTVAVGDVVFRIGPLARDIDRRHRGVRAYRGWHAQDGMKLTKPMRRRAWTGCWGLGEIAPDLVGGHAAAAVSGFVVDEAVVVDYEYCPGCGLVNLIVIDVQPKAVKYLDSRVPVVQGPLWTRS